MAELSPAGAGDLRGRGSRSLTNPSAALLATGVAALLIPTLLSLAHEHWSTSNGAHGPIILVSGVWLLWRERSHIHFRPGSIANPWLFLLVPLLLIYAYGRGFGLLGTESAAAYAVLILLGFAYWGPAVMRRLWFPVMYLAFLIKPPFGLVAELTQPLKIAISAVSVDLLYRFGYPIGKSGVLIQVGQYELLVEQACAGLSSLVTLFAIGLLYVHLAGSTGRRHTAWLLLSILPIAIFANLLRVIILILLTYHVGDGVAQSFAHDMAGVATFALSIVGMMFVDFGLRRAMPAGAAQ